MKVEQELCAEVSITAFDDRFVLCTSKGKEGPSLKFKCGVLPCSDLLGFSMKPWGVTAEG